MIVCESGVFTTERFGFWQLIVASSESSGALDEEAVASFSSSEQFSKSVGAVTVTVFF